jgi:hypothetical protein
MRLWSVERTNVFLLCWQGRSGPTLKRLRRVHLFGVDTYLDVSYVFVEGEVPWQQIRDPAGGVVWDPFEDLVQVEFGIEPLSLADPSSE